MFQCETTTHIMPSVWTKICPSMWHGNIEVFKTAQGDAEYVR